MEVNDERHAPVALTPGMRSDSHWIGGWVGPRVGVDLFGEEENLFPLPGYEHGIVQSVA
jgi:hypothetical protein